MTDVYVAGNGVQPDPKPENSQKQEIATGAELKTGKVKQLVETVLDRAHEIPGKYVSGAYNVSPDSRFINEQDDEDIVLLIRAHPITNLGWIVGMIIFLLVMEVLLGTGMLGGLPGKYVMLGRLVIYLIALGFAFEKFLDWYYTVLIVTNERVVDVDYVNLLYREVVYATLNHIEEPSMVSGGLMRSIFHYGDVFIETAAESPSIEALAIPYPDRVIRIISELSEELEKRRELGQ